MAKKTSTIGRIVNGASVLPCRGITYQTEVAVRTMGHSGLPQPTNVQVDGTAPPTIQCDMHLDAALTQYGLGVNEYATAGSDAIAFVLANLVGASVDTGSTHTKISSLYKATGFIQSFTVAEGQAAFATVLHHMWSSDGDTSPSEATLVALPALTAIPKEHGIGELTINGTVVPGVTGISYASGITISAQRTDGNGYPISGIYAAGSPQLTISTNDFASMQAILGDLGAEITAATSITLKTFDNSILSDSDAITLTISQGYVQPQPYAGTEGQEMSGGCIITASSSTGATPGIVVS